MGDGTGGGWTLRNGGRLIPQTGGRWDWWEVDPQKWWEIDPANRWEVVLQEAGDGSLVGTLATSPSLVKVLDGQGRVWGSNSEQLGKMAIGYNSCNAPGLYVNLAMSSHEEQVQEGATSLCRDKSF